MATPADKHINTVRFLASSRERKLKEKKRHAESYWKVINNVVARQNRP